VSLKKIIEKSLGIKGSYYLRKITGKLKPDSIRIDITASCNAKCPFCPREVMPEDRKSGFMDMDLYRYILKEAKSIGIKKAKLYISSEPSVHPKFDEMVSMAKEQGFKVYLSTNASNLHKHTEAFKKADVLQFSLEGWDKESYEKYRKPLKFDRIYENMKLYSEASEGIDQVKSLHIPITKETDLEKFVLLWGNFVDRLDIDFMQPMNIFTQGAMKSAYGENIKENYYNFSKMNKNFVCYDPFKEVTVGYDGKILLCCLDFSGLAELGNIKDGIRSVINHPNLKKIQKQFFTQKMDYCSDCCQFYLADLNDIKTVWKRVKELQKKNLCTAELSFVTPHLSKEELEID